LCRKAIGFLFFKPVVCCSIIVSILRAGEEDIEEAVISLLFDPLLINYGGRPVDYLRTIPSTDTASGGVQRALSKLTDYHSALVKVGTIKELSPSEYQRDVVRHRMEDEMRVVNKVADQHSILANLVHRSTILYGRRSINYIVSSTGERTPLAMDLNQFSFSFDLPRQEVLDPVELDYLVRLFRAERQK
jgi:hypothetical protein